MSGAPHPRFSVWISIDSAFLLQASRRRISLSCDGASREEKDSPKPVLPDPRVAQLRNTGSSFKSAEIELAQTQEVLLTQEVLRNNDENLATKALDVL